LNFLVIRFVAVLLSDVTSVTTEPTLLGIAAFITAIGGVASTILALRRSRGEDYEHCLQQLKESRAEAERLAQELHDLRMYNEE
jgi:hypothetical protein